MKAFKYFILPLFSLAAAFLVFSNLESKNEDMHAQHLNNKYSSQNLAPQKLALQKLNLGPAPSFELESTLQKPFSSESMKGKVWLFNLFFTTCTGPCPITGAHLKKIYTKHQDNDSFSIVSLTVDPENDTKQKLIEHQSKIGVAQSSVSQGRWNFVRADLPKVKELSESFKMDVMQHHGMVHRNRVVLIGSNNQILGTYLGTESADMKKLGSKLEELLVKS